MNQSDQTKRILITGGAGFIGSHLVEVYRAAGWVVAVVDNLKAGHRTNIADPAVAIYAIDIKDQAQLESVFREWRPTHLSHHAAQINVRHSLENPIDDALDNIIGTLNVLELAVKHKLQQAIFASSGGAIYGESEDRVPFTETAPKQPMSPYAISKLAGETYMEYYASRHRLPITILRYANVYGPRQDPAGEAGVISQFLDRLVNRQPLTINGSGEQRRDFIFVSDVAAANLLATTGPHLGVFNIGAGHPTSVLELASLLARLWQQRTGHRVPPPVHGPAIVGEVFYSMISTDKAKAALAWQPTITLEEGLQATINWFEQRPFGGQAAEKPASDSSQSST